MVEGFGLADPKIPGTYSDDEMFSAVLQHLAAEFTTSPEAAEELSRQIVNDVHALLARRKQRKHGRRIDKAEALVLKRQRQTRRAQKLVEGLQRRHPPSDTIGIDAEATLAAARRRGPY